MYPARTVKRRSCVSPYGSLAFVLAVLALGFCWSGAAQGGFGSLDLEPGEQEVVANAEFRVTATSHWPDGYGYRPMHVRIEPVKLLLADRVLTLRMESSRGYGGPVSVQREVEINAGTAPVELTLAVPIEMEQYLQMIVLENGEPIPKLAAGMNFSGLRYRDFQDSPLFLLAVDPPSPDTSQLAPVFVRSQSNNQPQYGASAPAIPSAAISLSSAKACRMEALPERWIELSGLDCVLIGLDRLETLQATRPAAHRALMQWTFSGGNLLIYGAGDKGENLGRLSRAAGWPKDAKSESVDDWQKPAASEFGRNVILDDAETGLVDVAETTERKQPPTGDPKFRLHTLGQGMVVAISSASPLPGETSQWKWLFNCLGKNRWDWTERHGLVPGASNQFFWNFAIPGVGLTPVKTFCVLITLFACVIGPVNYWMLKRKRRIHLLVMTIPCGALLVTLAMLGYAIVADGLGTRVRMRSVTMIDQARGQACCWNRIAYYAGLAPRGGLTFSEDTTVFPILQDSDGSRSFRSRPREMLWEGTQQQLTSGWVAARTPAQLLAVRSRAAQFSVELIPSADGGNPQVENRLGTKIEQLFLCDAQGRLFQAEGIENGKRAAMEPIDAEAAKTSMRRIVRAHALQFPPGMLANNGWSPSGMRNRRYSPYGYYQGVKLTNGVLERSIAVQETLQPQSYAAVVERSPEAVSGLQDVKEEAGFHLILGTW